MRFTISLSIVLIAFDATKIRRMKHEGLRISVSKRCSVLYLYLYLWNYGRFIAKYLKHIIALKEMAIINE
jgi:hypothetical protein